MPAARSRGIPSPLSADLDQVLPPSPEVWEALRGKRLFITGGTGFFGCWLLESLAWANARLNLEVSAQVLTRNPAAFAHKCPHLAQDPTFDLVRGDVRSFELPGGRCDLVIHAAAEGSAVLAEHDPATVFDIIVKGTQRTVDYAAAAGARKFLLTSSGAVYGRQPPEIPHLSEDYRGGPDPTAVGAAYAEGKRAAEQMVVLCGRRDGFEPKIARCFTFVGPYLPLDRHFALGSFIRDGLAGGPIWVSGDGTPFRSYLYAADLAIWLWTILARGEAGRAYNVGSERALSIAELAHLVAGEFDPVPEVKIRQEASPGVALERYVPSTARARTELGLSESVPLADGLARTLRWLRLVQAPGPVATSSR